MTKTVVIKGMMCPHCEAMVKKLLESIDGVTEATNAHNELYGEERLLRLLDTFGDIPMEEVCARVKAHVDAFVGDAPQFDDITMLGFRYMGGNVIN